MCGKSPMMSGFYQQISMEYLYQHQTEFRRMQEERAEQFTRDLLAGKVFEAVPALC